MDFGFWWWWGGGGEEGRGKVLSSFRELGRSYITFRDMGSTVKIILGSIRKYHKGAREIWALFSGSKGALTPTPTYAIVAQLVWVVSPGVCVGLEGGGADVIVRESRNYGYAKDHRSFQLQNNQYLHA